MKRVNFSIALILIGLATTVIMSSFMLNSTGAPAKKTGSPSDGANCTECHLGLPVKITTGIQTNIPPEGYTAGTTYTITTTNPATGFGKMGFELTAQDAAGVVRGTFTNGIDTKLVGSGKYITHSVANTSISSWTFQWTAPAAGTGAITFYAAFNQGPAGVATVSLTSLLVREKISASIKKIENSKYFIISSAKERGFFYIQLADNKNSRTILRVFNINGRIVYEKVTKTGNEKTLLDLSKSPTGIYIIEALYDGKVAQRKIMLD